MVWVGGFILTASNWLLLCLSDKLASCVKLLAAMFVLGDLEVVVCVRQMGHHFARVQSTAVFILITSDM